MSRQDPRDPASGPPDPQAFLEYYSFDLEWGPVDSWLQEWAQVASPIWIRAALLEALYQGRYKATSVKHLLQRWSSRGQPRLSFDRDFVRKVWPAVYQPVTTLLATLPTQPQLQPLRPNLEDFSLPFTTPAISTHPLVAQLQKQPLSPKLAQLLTLPTALDRMAPSP
ncbi:MAG: hypothetical protein HC921_06835 [Synechococcaceae cyanobacterium SM2_3_1]|nr:hypothetical protein [Synechococcaceae cyanobacterium SM2_3_1]